MRQARVFGGGVKHAAKDSFDVVKNYLDDHAAGTTEDPTALEAVLPHVEVLLRRLARVRQRLGIHVGIGLGEEFAALAAQVENRSRKQGRSWLGKAAGLL